MCANPSAPHPAIAHPAPHTATTQPAPHPAATPPAPNTATPRPQPSGTPQPLPAPTGHPTSQHQQPDPATLAARMGSPFTAAEVTAFASNAKPRKAVAGELPPWFLKAAAGHVAPLLAALFSRWWHLGQLPYSAAISILNPVPKPGGDPTSCSSLRGIALGTMAAKLYAAILEQRVSDWAEASGTRAAGQYGFRRKRSTSQAAFILRTLQDQHRQAGQELWVCFVDFEQAYDRVPRQQLWRKLLARGVSPAWVEAVQALYADVPMSVRTAAGLSPCFQCRVGVKQGCPLSPTLFGLYIDDLEAAVLEAAQRGEQLDLPSLLGSDSPVPPLMYADDLALLATSAAGLQRQLNLLQRYCQQWGLTVNTVKTKAMLLSGAGKQHAAQTITEAAGLTFGGRQLEAVTSFKYLGITFHSTTCLAGAAAPARTQLARLAMHNCRARCAELGIESAAVQLRLFGVMVDTVLSYGAEVWGVQLATKAACSSAGNAGSAAEKLQLSYLRHLLGVRQGTPNAVVLAETGEAPLWQRWLRRAAKFWNKLLAEEEGSLVHMALQASIRLAGSGAAPPARQSWAAQLAAGMTALQLPLALEQPAPVNLEELMEAAQKRQLAQFHQAATRAGATKLQQYEVNVWGGFLTYGALSQRPKYLDEVRQRQHRGALAQIRTGSHWGAEETGRWARQPRELRLCLRCDMGAIEDAPHMCLHCPFYDPVRACYPDLFADAHDTARLSSFLSLPPRRVADFASACRQRWQATAPAD